MKTLTIRIESLESLGQSVVQVMQADMAETSAGLSFASYAEMHRILTPKRLEIIRTMAGQEALSYREVARRVGRDFKGVHTDLTAMIAAGVIDRQADGVVFPYESIHFDFDIQANAA
jgi:predicted transcriptional regulator